MGNDAGRDQLALIKIEGMHCHKCEKAIQKALLQRDGVHEVEVDFPSGQASVLFDDRSVNVRQLIDSVAEAGYKITGFTQREADQSSGSNDPSPVSH